MSDTNRVKLAVVEEVTQGTTPATPAFEEIRNTSQPDLAFTPTSVDSDEIRADRQTLGPILVGAESGGSYNFEMSFESQDTLLEGVMASRWVNKPSRILTSGGSEVGAVDATDFIVSVVAGDAFVEGMLVRTSNFAETGNNKLFRALTGTTTSVVKTSGNTVEASPPDDATVRAVGFEGDTDDIVATATGLTSTLLDFTTLELTAGQWIKIGGSVAINQFGTAVLNDWVRVTSVAANVLTLEQLPSGWTTDTGSGKEIMIFFGDYIVNGTTEIFYTLERTYTDHSPVDYEYQTGMEAGNYSINAPNQSVATGSFTFSGFQGAFTTTRFAGATDIAANSNDVMNTSSNVGRIAIDGVPITGKNYVLETAFAMNGNLRQKPAVGSLGAIGIGQGEFQVTGNLNTYFDDATYANYVINQTELSFDILFFDVDDQYILYDFPSIKLKTGAPAIPGKNQDVTLNADFGAFMNSTLGYTALIQRFHEVQ